MLNENARKWVEALRSGEFQQCCGKLCGADDVDEQRRYCCLGVACEIAIRNGVYVAVDEIVEGDKLKVSFDNVTDLLPDTVTNWLGLRTDDGCFTADHRHKSTLVAMNDDGASFAEIADMIESEPEGLFA